MKNNRGVSIGSNKKLFSPMSTF